MAALLMRSCEARAKALASKASRAWVRSQVNNNSDSSGVCEVALFIPQGPSSQSPGGRGNARRGGRRWMGATMTATDRDGNATKRQVVKSPRAAMRCDAMRCDRCDATGLVRFDSMRVQLNCGRPVWPRARSAKKACPINQRVDIRVKNVRQASGGQERLI